MTPRSWRQSDGRGRWWMLPLPLPAHSASPDIFVWVLWLLGFNAFVTILHILFMPGSFWRINAFIIELLQTGLIMSLSPSLTSHSLPALLHDQHHYTAYGKLCSENTLYCSMSTVYLVSVIAGMLQVTRVCVTILTVCLCLSCRDCSRAGWVVATLVSCDRRLSHNCVLTYTRFTCSHSSHHYPSTVLSFI